MEKKGEFSGKERIASLDYLRTVCAFIIIIFHLSCHLPDSAAFKPFYVFGGGTWGNVAVNMFFMLSGFVLFYSNSEIKSLKTYFYKRAKSVYPAYYIAFAAFFLLTVIREKNFFYGGNFVKILLSVVGVDGYAEVLGMPTYYQVGEWFLGAIIILYALYPVILAAFKRCEFLTFAVSLLLYGTVFIKGIYPMGESVNPFSWILSFVTGMLLMKYKDRWYNKFPVFAAATVISAIFLFSGITSFIHTDISEHITALCMFFFLCFAGEYIMKAKFFARLFSYLGTVSYCMFLLQHKVVVTVLMIYVPLKPAEIAVFSVLCILLTVFPAILLNKAVNLIFKTGFIKRFEEKIFF